MPGTESTRRGTGSTDEKQALELGPDYHMEQLQAPRLHWAARSSPVNGDNDGAPAGLLHGRHAVMRVLVAIPPLEGGESESAHCCNTARQARKHLAWCLPRVKLGPLGVRAGRCPVTPEARLACPGHTAVSAEAGFLRWSRSPFRPPPLRAHPEGNKPQVLLAWPRTEPAAHCLHGASLGPRRLAVPHLAWVVSSELLTGGLRLPVRPQSSSGQLVRWESGLRSGGTLRLRCGWPGV